MSPSREAACRLILTSKPDGWVPTTTICSEVLFAATLIRRPTVWTSLPPASTVATSSSPVNCWVLVDCGV